MFDSRTPRDHISARPNHNCRPAISQVTRTSPDHSIIHRASSLKTVSRSLVWNVNGAGRGAR